jgi:hypothetical protein
MASLMVGRRARRAFKAFHVTVDGKPKCSVSSLVFEVEGISRRTKDSCGGSKAQCEKMVEELRTLLPHRTIEAVEGQCPEYVRSQEDMYDE